MASCQPSYIHIDHIHNVVGMDLASIPDAVDSTNDASEIAEDKRAVVTLLGRKRKRYILCQICGEDLIGEKAYYQRYRICRGCSSKESVEVDGLAQRFCQQCGRFQHVDLFDGTNRTCRERLDRHAARRRRNNAISRTLRDVAQKNGLIQGGNLVLPGPNIYGMNKNMTYDNGSAMPSKVNLLESSSEEAGKPLGLVPDNSTLARSLYSGLGNSLPKNQMGTFNNQTLHPDNANIDNIRRNMQYIAMQNHHQSCYGTLPSIMSRTEGMEGNQILETLLKLIAANNIDISNIHNYLEGKLAQKQFTVAARKEREEVNGLDLIATVAMRDCTLEKGVTNSPHANALLGQYSAQLSTLLSQNLNHIARNTPDYTFETHQNKGKTFASASRGMSIARPDQVQQPRVNYQAIANHQITKMTPRSSVLFNKQNVPEPKSFSSNAVSEPQNNVLSNSRGSVEDYIRSHQASIDTRHGDTSKDFVFDALYGNRAKAGFIDVAGDSKNVENFSSREALMKLILSSLENPRTDAVSKNNNDPALMENLANRKWN